MNNKSAILLNYGLMSSDVFSDMKEYAQIIGRFFKQEPELKTDKDLLKIAEKFNNLCIAIKELDEELEKYPLFKEGER